MSRKQHDYFCHAWRVDVKRLIYANRCDTYTLRIVNYVHSNCIDGNEHRQITICDPRGKPPHGPLYLSLKESCPVARKAPTKFQVLPHEFARICVRAGVIWYPLVLLEESGLRRALTTDQTQPEAESQQQRR